MHMRSLTLALLVALTTTASLASAAQRLPLPRNSNPWGSLFQPPTPQPPESAPQLPSAPRFFRVAPVNAGQASAPQSHVVCGTTVVPVDPTFDARIRRAAPTVPRLASRSVVPPVCTTPPQP
jgi:hypothetical protein